MIQEAGRGAVIYLRPHGLGDTLSQRLSRPFNHDTADTPVESVHHATLEYGTGSQILAALGVRTLRLITNSDADYPLLQSFGLTVRHLRGVRLAAERQVGIIDQVVSGSRPEPQARAAAAKAMTATTGVGRMIHQ